MNLSLASIASSISNPRSKDGIFRDLPLIDHSCALTVVELYKSDKQIVNELVYRWCRILTRPSRIEVGLKTDTQKVLILDLTSSVSIVRLATVLKRDEKRMQMVHIAQGCKINSSFVTIQHYLNQFALNCNSPPLIVIYHDEFFISKTLAFLSDLFISSQILLIVPSLDRQQMDALNLRSNRQILRCDFCVKRRDIIPGFDLDRLNKVQFTRKPRSKTLPDTVFGEIVKDGLHIYLKK